MPVFFFNRDTKMPGGFEDICKGQVALTVRYLFDLIESCQGIPDVFGIRQGFFTLFWKCIDTFRQFFSIFCIQFAMLYMGLPRCGGHNYLLAFYMNGFTSNIIPISLACQPGLVIEQGFLNVGKQRHPHPRPRPKAGRRGRNWGAELRSAPQFRHIFGCNTEIEIF